MTPARHARRHHRPPVPGTLSAMSHACTDLAYARAQDLPCAEALLRRLLRCYAQWARREAQRTEPTP